MCDIIKTPSLCSFRLKAKSFRIYGIYHQSISVMWNSGIHFVEIFMIWYQYHRHQSVQFGQETLIFFEKDHLNLERKPIQCFTEIATKIISDLELGNLFFLYSYSYYLLSLFDLSNLFHLSNLFDSCTLFFLLCTRFCFEDQPTDRPTDLVLDAS